MICLDNPACRSLRVNLEWAYAALWHLYEEKVGGADGARTRDPGVTGRYSNQLNYRSVLVGGAGIEPATLAL